MHCSRLDRTVDCLVYYRSHTSHRPPRIGHLSCLRTSCLRNLDIPYVQSLLEREIQAAHHRRHRREDGQQVAVAENSRFSGAVRFRPTALFFGSCHPRFPLHFFFVSLHPKRLCPCFTKAGKTERLIAYDMTRVRLCFHDRCFDGTASAALFYRFYKEKF